jgi:hypothetical protein
LLILDFTRRRLGVTLGDYLRVWVKPLACALVPLGVWLAVGAVSPAWGAIAAGIGLGLAPYVLLVAGAEGLLPALPRRGGERVRLRRAARYTSPDTPGNPTDAAAVARPRPQPAGRLA